MHRDHLAWRHASVRPTSRRHTTTLSILRRPTWSSCSSSTRWRPRRWRWGVVKLSWQLLVCGSAGQGTCACTRWPKNEAMLPHHAVPRCMLRFCMLTPPVQASPCPQDVFTFEHPNRAHCIDNTRSIRLVFECTPPAGTGAWLGCGVKEMLAGWRCFAPSHLGPCMNLPLTCSPLFCGLPCSPSFAGLLPNLLHVLTPLACSVPRLCGLL